METIVNSPSALDARLGEAMLVLTNPAPAVEAKMVPRKRGSSEMQRSDSLPESDGVDVDETEKDAAASPPAPKKAALTRSSSAAETPTTELAEHRVAQRLKQVALGKATEG